MPTTPPPHLVTPTTNQYMHMLLLSHLYTSPTRNQVANQQSNLSYTEQTHRFIDASPFLEVQLRFCPSPYRPFDADDTESFIVAGHYKHAWEMRSLSPYYQHHSRKQSLDLYFRQESQETKSEREEGFSKVTDLFDIE